MDGGKAWNLVSTSLWIFQVSNSKGPHESEDSRTRKKWTWEAFQRQNSPPLRARRDLGILLEGVIITSSEKSVEPSTAIDGSLCAVYLYFWTTKRRWFARVKFCLLWLVTCPQMAWLIMRHSASSRWQWENGIVENFRCWLDENYLREAFFLRGVALS